MQQPRLALSVLGALVCLLPGFGEAQTPSREMLLFMTVPTVVTATLRPQPIARAPSTVTVITAEDIRLSGATSIPDLLRNVSGIDVFRVSASDINVTGRGLNERVANRTQVFIDGRPALEDLFNLVFWEHIPVSLEEVDRIEVITGPASALFGTNASSGVVQIITKSPEALRGTHLVGRGGTAGAGAGTLILAETAGPLGSKLVLEYDRVNRSPDPLNGRTDDEKGREDARGAALAEYLPRRGTLVSLAGGGNRLDRDIDPAMGASARPGFGHLFPWETLGFGLLKVSHGEIIGKGMLTL